MIDTECPDCGSDVVTASDCDPECLTTNEHLHLHCRECDYEWTEQA